MLLLVALAACAWLALLMLAPLLAAPLAAALYAVGAQICHQRPERSFHLFAAQLPVCARCLGLYAGAALGSPLALASAVRARIAAWPSRMLLVTASIPTVLTLVAEWSGAWGGSNAVRAAAGLPLGGAVALVVARAVATLHYGGCAPRRPIASNRPPTPI
ncbi:MAG: hypothetical protein DMF87_19875 [Acidobacteria bacterium]|nr:MAG: hypothetical protein DMF87_19875 [Acidobacteriota bacterium]